MSDPIEVLELSDRAGRPVSRGGERSMWSDLERSVWSEGALASRSADELRDAWRLGRAAVACDGGRVVSYVALEPCFDSSLRDVLGGELAVPIGVFESRTGWTDPDYRRRGLNLELRKRLYGAHEGALILSASIGMGASHVLHRLGWSLFSFASSPFVASFVGWPSGGRMFRPDGAHKGAKPVLPYCETSLINPQDDGNHDWEGHIHLWTCDMVAHEKLEERFERAFDGKLAEWQQVLLVRASIPGRATLVTASSMLRELGAD